MKLNLNRMSVVAGFIGSVTILVGSTITALVYTGSKGEVYSPLNHWVSELGQASVSQAAIVFNASLIIGAICFVIFTAGVAEHLQGWFRDLFRWIGVLAGAAGILVGVFSIDNLTPHALAACSLFLTILLLVSSFSLYVLLSRPTLFPLWLVIPGGLTIFGIIGCMMSVGSFSVEALAPPKNRVPFWNVSIFEWIAICSLLAWVFLVALRLQLAEQKFISSVS
ncbi:MAG: DUF998 domain-containing protein [Chloroflexota bacterium]